MSYGSKACVRTAVHRASIKCKTRLNSVCASRQRQHWIGTRIDGMSGTVGCCRKPSGRATHSTSVMSWLDLRYTFE